MVTTSEHIHQYTLDWRCAATQEPTENLILVGLEGKMTATVAGAKTPDESGEAADDIGPLPHGKLGFGLFDRPKKQEARMWKAECAVCGYVCRVALKWLDDVGPPYCRDHAA